jgi:hypothetical protein
MKIKAYNITNLTDARNFAAKYFQFNGGANANKNLSALRMTILQIL